MVVGLLKKNFVHISKASWALDQCEKENLGFGKLFFIFDQKITITHLPKYSHLNYYNTRAKISLK